MDTSRSHLTALTLLAPLVIDEPLGEYPVPFPLLTRLHTYEYGVLADVNAPEKHFEAFDHQGGLRARNPFPVHSAHWRILNNETADFDAYHSHTGAVRLQL